MFVPQIGSLQQVHMEFSQLGGDQLSQDPVVLQLSFPDQCEFLRLSAFFKYASDRNKRNLALATFSKHLQLIKNFVNRGDYGDFERGVACGIQFGSNYMLVNTKRLKIFMGRSKSCINGCFHKLGYGVYRISSDDNPILADFTARSGRQLPQPRQWCIRSSEQLLQGPSPEASSDNEIDIEDRSSEISQLQFLDIKSLLNRRAESYSGFH